MDKNEDYQAGYDCCYHLDLERNLNPFNPDTHLERWQYWDAGWCACNNEFDPGNLIHELGDTLVEDE